MTTESGDRDFYTYTPEHRFAKMYPLLAKQILEDYGDGKHTVLDIGTGGAALLIEMAKITDMKLIGLDMKELAIEIARQNMKEHQVPEERVQFLQGDVVSIPLPDGAADLIISRGSIPFWEDMSGAFAEIYRVLSPGGRTFIGCGFSRYQPLDEVKKMRPDWSKKGNDDPRNSWKEEGRIPQALTDAGVENYTMHCDSYGVWIEMSKPA